MDKKKAAAATMAGVIAASGAAVDTQFDSPADILQNNTPEPVVQNIDTGGDDGTGTQDDRSKQAAQEKKTLRERILELPLAVRVIFVVPLWAVGHVLVMAGGALVTALSPLWNGITSFLMFALLMLALFTVGAKMMFPDLPLRKILNRHTIKGVLIASAGLFVADWGLPLIWPGYVHWKTLVLGILGLFAIIALLLRFGKKEEKRRAEEAEEEYYEESEELLVVSSMGQTFTMPAPKRRPIDDGEE